MSAKSDYLENKVLLDNIVNGTPYIALFNTDPTDAGTGTELSNIGYSRFNATGLFSTPSGGVTSNTALISFGPAGETWASAGWVAIFDAATGGNLLYHGPLGTARTAAQYDSLEFAIGALVLGET